MPDNSPLQRYVEMRSGGFYAWDVVQNRFWADETFAEITGFSVEELNEGLPAERMMAIIHKDDVPHVAEAIENSVLLGKPFEMIYRVRRGDSYVTLTEIGKCFRYVDGMASLFTGVVFEAGHTSSAQASNANMPKSLSPASVSYQSVQP